MYATLTSSQEGQNKAHTIINAALQIMFVGIQRD